MAKKPDFMTGFNQATQKLPASTFSEQEKIKKSIVVIDELKRYIPALTQEEYKQLENNIVEHGCKDPLTIWETTEKIAEISADETPVFVMIDGHNRYEICQKHQLDFKITSPLNFDSIAAAKSFMINHQLGRRNLSPEQISYFRGLKYLSLKEEKGKYERENHNGKNYHYDENSNTEVPENTDENHNGKIYHYDKNDKIQASENTNEDHNGKNYHYEKMTTAEELAKEFNVSEKTIRNDAQFAKSIENLSPELRTEILQGKSTLTKSEIIGLGKTEETNKKEKEPKPTNSAKDKISNLLKQNKESLSIQEFKELQKEIKQIIDERSGKL